MSSRLYKQILQGGTIIVTIASLVSSACAEARCPTDVNSSSREDAKNSTVIAPPKVRIVLAGDSTVTDQAGWGKGFRKCLADNVECINLAKGGASSKSYIEAGRWRACRALHPSYLLIQFGHNDQPGKGPQRETLPQTTYRKNLIKIIDEARKSGIRPILVTSLSRREWNAQGKIESSLLPYVEVVKQIAAEKQVLCIDLHARSIELCEKLGKDGCLAISPKTETGYDGTHLNAKGSEMIGAIVAAEMMKAELSLVRLFKSAPSNNTLGAERKSATGSTANAIRVAAISFVPVRFDLAHNAEALEHAFREAKQGGAQIAVAPEGCLEGYVVNEIIAGKAPPERMKEVAVPIDGPVIQRFQKLAAALDMCLVFGFAEKIGDDVFNASVFIDNRGKICGKHHKLQLAEGYDPAWWFNRLGQQCRAFDTPYGRCGLLICNERWNPSLSRILALDGAQFLLISANGSRKPTQDEAVLNRGRENRLPVVEANVGVTLIVDDGNITSIDRNEKQITFGHITPAPVAAAQPKEVNQLEQEFLEWRQQEMQRKLQRTLEKLKKAP
ncbi:MAG: nitrilase-related carbon-nitrogen hydrolase [Pirellulales bacterium]